MAYIVGVDIGGTFTDCAVFDSDTGSFTTAKAPTTPRNPAQGFFDAIEVAAKAAGIGLEDYLRRTSILVNGTTVGTNAIVTRRGAKVGLLATKGHGEAILIMRGGGRTKGLTVDELLYVPGTQKPERIVPRNFIEEVTERIDCRGEVVVELDEEAAEASIRRLVGQGAEALAICLLWSFSNPAHEQALKRLAQRIAPDLFVSCSCEVSPAIGEYGRTVATVMNAYIGPIMKQYVSEIAQRAHALGHASGVLFAQCVGGCVPAADAAAVPLYTVDSGPVSGVEASSVLGPKMGYPNIITTDMGGTTFDVGIIHNGAALTRNQTVLEQYEMSLPMVDVVSIGAGGGSIAFIDQASGMMRVGPRSAGADPGPICYGRGGGEPTVTDANVVLGIINPDYFLGGQQRLDAGAARDGVARLAARLGLSLEKTAAGICRIVDTRMAGEIRRLTLFRGYDPREFVVFAFGGGGPTHAGMYATELGVKQVIVPLRNTAAAWSALGAFASGVVHLYEANEYLREPVDPHVLGRTFAALEERARRQLTDEGFPPDQIVMERSIGMRYVAQVSYLEIAVPRTEIDEGRVDQLLKDFESTYAQRYGEGAGYREAGIEVLKQRVRAVGLLPAIELAQHKKTRKRLESAKKGERPAYWWELERFENTPIYDGDLLASGHKLKGPAIIELAYTTVPVRPDQSAAIDNYGNLALKVG
ncbi:MAG TPA: hydantoinase/oxoprolinase family protein [Candidatus Binataceae bacterium]|nr:hydantoinase/oxoprolinase family protein [Candidatus Binataceae bacterium]